MLTFTASAATTGSNTFVGNQVVSGSLTVTGSITTPGTLTAQTLVVQTITSSVSTITGSTQFGSTGSNTHQFTGSVSIIGNITSNSTNGISGTFRSNTFFGSIDLENTGGDVAGKWNVQSVSGTQVGGSAGSSFGIYSYGASAYRLWINNSGSVGIGTTNPLVNLQVETTGTSTSIGGNVIATFRSQAAGRAATIQLSDFTNSNYISSLSGSLGFGSAGTLLMTLNSSGNLGLGVTPSAWSGRKVIQADVSSFSSVSNNMYLGTNYYDNGVNNLYINNGFASLYAQASSTHVWYIAPSGTAGNAISFTQAMTLTSVGDLYLGNTSFTSPNGADRFIGVYGGQDCSLILQDAVQLWELYVNDDFYINRGSTNVLTALRSNGNVGIGMTDPQSSLHIIRALGNNVISIGESGTNIRFTIGQESGYTGNYINSTNIDLKLQSYLSGGTGGNIIFQTGASGSGSLTPRMTITSGGNVGIGTTSPSQLLEVVGGEIKAGRVDSTNEGGQVSFGRASDNATGYYIDLYGSTSTPVLRFIDVSNATEIMRLTTTTPSVTPCVLINKTSAGGSYALQVAGSNGAIMASATGTGDANIYSTSTTVGYHFYAESSTAKFYVQNGGSTYNATGVYGTISDLKLKENIVNATPKLNDLLNLKVRNFNFIGENEKQLGFIAQEFEEVFPNLIEVDLKTKNKTIKTSVLVPMLVKAIQELKAEFDEYKATHP
jgi:hypothetical protein